MTDKQLIGEIRKLRQIKPAKSWVSLVKKGVLGEEPGFTFFPYFKPVFSGASVVLALVALFGFSQNVLPGDFLYPVKKMVEKGQAAFVSNENKPVFDLELANDRLDDLTYAPAENLGPTINEFQANVLEAAKKLKKVDATTSDPVVMKKIVAAAKKVEEGKQKAESLGVVFGEEGTAELNSALKTMAENLIFDLEKRSLSEEKVIVLEQMKELFEKGRYTEALELYLNNQ